MCTSTGLIPAQSFILNLLDKFKNRIKYNEMALLTSSLNSLLSLQILNGNVEEKIYHSIHDLIRNYAENFKEIMKGVYVIKFRSEEDWSNLIDALAEYAEKLWENKKIKMHFIISPLTNSSFYNGWLPRKKWKELIEMLEEI